VYQSVISLAISLFFNQEEHYLFSFLSFINPALDILQYLGTLPLSLSLSLSFSLSEIYLDLSLQASALFIEVV